MVHVQQQTTLHIREIRLSDSYTTYLNQLLASTWVVSCHNQPVGLGVMQRLVDPGPLLVGSSLGDRPTGRTASDHRVSETSQQDCVDEDKLHCDVSTRNGQHLEKEGRRILLYCRVI